MKIEIRATYPATDGSMPEDVSVEVDLGVAQDGMDFTQGMLLPVLDRMFSAARERASSSWIPTVREQLPQDGINAPVSTGERMHMPVGVLHEECRRVGCGHRRYNHLDVTVDGAQAEAGPYLGRCFQCDNSHCPYFVGQSVGGMKA